MPFLIWRIMKTHKHLYPLITDFENLYLAFRRAVNAAGEGKTWQVFFCALALLD
jgi:hypothetical protein